jgi:predicted nucleic acid-binding protein
MLLTDVNVLVYAHREDAVDHPSYWEIFKRSCRECDIRGSMVTDAYFAALALESGCEWVTTDRDYSRFPGLAWRHPLKPGPGTGAPA